MKLSIVIPAYNAAPFLGRCVGSICQQVEDKDNLEIIIINDGSTDDTQTIALKQVELYPFISVISQENQGLSAARNAGLTKADGDYVWFVDADDWIAEHSLSKILNKIGECNPDVLCLRAGDLVEDHVIPRFSFSSISDLTGKEALKKWKSPCAPFFVFKKDFIDSNNLSFVKGLYHEDTEFTPRALYLAEKVSYLDIIAYIVFANPSSITRSNNTKRAFDTLIVCRMLETFMEERVKDEDKPLFSSIISISINSSFYDVIHNMDEKAQHLFDDVIYEERGLLSHFWKSMSIKYRIEYLILRSNIKHTTKAYKLFTKYN